MRATQDEDFVCVRLSCLSRSGNREEGYARKDPETDPFVSLHAFTSPRNDCRTEPSLFQYSSCHARNRSEERCISREGKATNNKKNNSTR